MTTNKLKWHDMDKFELINDIFDVLQGNDEMCTQEAFADKYKEFYMDVEASVHRIRLSGNDRDYFITIVEQPKQTELTI